MAGFVDHQKLEERRKVLQESVVALEMGLLTEKRKIGELEFSRGKPIPGTPGLMPDDAAIDRQVAACRANIVRIEEVLVQEREKLQANEQGLAASNAILRMHGTTACLEGAAPHQWVYDVPKDMTGRFKRHCSSCNTVQRVGVP